MKKIVRTILYTTLAVEAAQYLVGAFELGENRLQTVLLLVLALSLLHFFLKPLISIVSLSTKGLGFVFLNFAMTVIVLYVSTLFISSFAIHSARLSNLVVFGFEIPSYDLTSLWAMVVSALVITLVYSFFDWLCSRR